MATIVIQEDTVELIIATVGVSGTTGSTLPIGDPTTGDYTAGLLPLTSATLLSDALQSVNLNLGVGDVVGPATSLDNELSLFNSTTGKIIKGGSGWSVVTGVLTGSGNIDMGTNAITNVGLVDGVDVSAHATRHQNGGLDEVNVGGLSGLLADGQTPIAHAPTHSDGGTDEITASNLGSGAASAGEVLTADGLGGNDYAPSGGTIIFATEVALLASTEADGSLAYAEDTDRFFFRKNAAWVSRGTFIATDAVTAPGTGTDSERWGAGTVASGLRSTALGFGANATQTGAIAIGDAAQATGTAGSIAIGDAASTSGGDNIALGPFSVASGSFDATALGSGAKALLQQTVAVGGNAQAQGASGTAVGVFAIALTNSTALGRSAFASGVSATAVGKDTDATQTSAVALGDGAQATGATGCMAFGLRAASTGVHVNAVAIGTDSLTTAAQRVTLGRVGGTSAQLQELQVSDGFAAFGATPPAIQPGAIVDASGGATVDAEARTAINALLAVMRINGLITP